MAHRGSVPALGPEQSRCTGKDKTTVSLCTLYAAEVQHCRREKQQETETMSISEMSTDTALGGGQDD